MGYLFMTIPRLAPLRAMFEVMPDEQVNDMIAHAWFKLAGRMVDLGMMDVLAEKDFSQLIGIVTIHAYFDNIKQRGTADDFKKLLFSKLDEFSQGRGP